MIGPMSLTVSENTDRHRYEAHDDSGVVPGFVEYVDHRGTRLLFHTEVDDAFEGQGVGSTLARSALDQAIASGLQVRVTCPFLVEWVEQHPEYAGHDRLTLR
jgi:predicted GNAT family acetyltransferase